MEWQYIYLALPPLAALIFAFVTSRSIKRSAQNIDMKRSIYEAKLSHKHLQTLLVHRALLLQMISDEEQGGLAASDLATSGTSSTRDQLAEIEQALATLGWHTPTPDEKRPVR